VHITAQGPRLRNDLYCVGWGVKLHYIMPCDTKPLIPPAQSIQFLITFTVKQFQGGNQEL